MTDKACLLRTALGLAARGWYVFPLRPGDKRPAISEWESRATRDRARITRCWSHGPYNIGLATGPSGLVIVDLDQPKPGQRPPAGWLIDGVNDGADVLTELADRHGQPVPFLTYLVTTGRGGTHLYFRHPLGEPLRNTAGKLGWLIDTRAHGGYVVAGGSSVNDNPYTVDHDTTPMVLPGWLFDLLRPAPLPAQCPVTVRLPNPGTSAYVRRAVDAELTRITNAPDHHNDALYLASVALGQLVAGGSLEPDPTRQALEHAGASVGLTGRAIARTIDSGFTAGARRPRQVAA